MQENGFSPGTHLLLDFYQAINLTDIAHVENALREAAHACGATVLQVQLHGFGQGQGVTGVAMLAESHISIHTWPETGFAAIDVFMCGKCDPTLAIAPLKRAFSPYRVVSSSHRRGETQASTFRQTLEK